MTKIIVALYEDAEHGRQTAEDLGSSGISQGEFALLAGDGQNDGGLLGGAESGDNLTRTLCGLGFTEDDAKLYGRAVKDGSSLVVARVGDEQAKEVSAVLERRPIVDIDSEDEDEGSSPEHEEETAEEQTLQSVEERLQVGKRQTGAGRVRIRTHVEDRPVEERIVLREEELHVERRPVDRKLSPKEAESILEERTIEVSASREEAVVSKEAHVVEEVVIGKTSREREEVIKDNVRRTTLEVDEKVAEIEKAEIKKRA